MLKVNAAMTQSVAPKTITFDEYLAYDNGSDARYELVDGEIVEMPPESRENNAIAINIAGR
jgi:Uma2 family endonuclease